jgi:crotonobetainyl-CoA:carnitine CoA-transferase CaiB-like acyl-CoA transferase
MDNSTATRPFSKLKGDPYRAFEELPAEVRRALQESLVDWCSLRAREWHLHLLRKERLRPAQAASVLVQTIRRLDHAEVAAFARNWPKGAAAYPHLAAGATLQRYAGTEGIPAAKPVVLAPPAKASGPKPAKAPQPRPGKPSAPKRAKARPGKRAAGRRACR